MWFIIFVSAIFGYLIAEVFSGKKSGEQGIIKSVIFKVGNKKVHIHHWFSFGIILLILFLIGYYSDFIYGILIGIIIQGLTYRDFYKIVYKTH